MADLAEDLEEPPVLSAQARRDSSGLPVKCHCAPGRLVPLRATRSESVSSARSATRSPATQRLSEFRTDM